MKRVDAFLRAAGVKTEGNGRVVQNLREAVRHAPVPRNFVSPSMGGCCQGVVFDPAKLQMK